ncbi:hypothetical protein MACJ_002981 [Theileria orientalis]|uniref:Uncharacterized protein n=1 Tax=Theileria orientalis TaxID=68886 RepID=A0A976M752_THEOR|nr:hypothetical protein MACJ_002981 [Theileria orientalis]
MFQAVNSKLLSFDDPKSIGDKDVLLENDVYRGRLPNGFKYSFYKKKIPNIEAFLEVCSGSSDENDDQRGIAHLCEHMMFMGSNKRRRLNSYGVKTNACTDYNHTLFYVITDSDLGCDRKEETLKRMLEPLYEVLEAPTQFNQYELEKERKAVFSEARIIKTAEYYKNCNAIKILHHENMLPKRFPIGDLEMMKTYTVEDAKRFHAEHYIPDNSHLFIQGDLDEAEVESAVENIFSKAVNPPNLEEIRLHYKDTEKERRKGMPAIKNVYGQKEPGFHIWSCDRLSSFSFEIMRKMAVPELHTFEDYFKDTLNRLLYKIININFSIIKRDLQKYKLVSGNFYDCVNEGCRIHSLDIKCDQNEWKDSIFYVISEVGRFLSENISSLYLNYAKDSLLYDFDSLEEDKNSTNRFIENEICRRVNLSVEQHKSLIKRSYDHIHPETIREGMNRIFSWYKKDLTDVKVFATSLTPGECLNVRMCVHMYVTLDEIKDVFFQSIDRKVESKSFQIDMPDRLLNSDQIKEIMSKSSSEVFPPMDKNFHLKTFDKEKYISQMPFSSRVLFEDYYGKFQEYLEDVKDVELYEPMPNSRPSDYELFLEKQYRCNPSTNEDLKYVYSLMNSNKTMIRTKPCKLYHNTINNSKDYDIASDVKATIDKNSTQIGNLKTQNGETKSTHSYVNKYINGYTSYTLNNNVRVNCKIVEENAIHVSANIPIIEYMTSNRIALNSSISQGTKAEKIKMNKMMLMLISGSLMESGSIGDLDRRQVELFCELNSIMVDISLSSDYLNINFEIPLASSNEDKRVKLLEYCLQMLNMLLENHQIKRDEFERAKQKLINDDREYKNSIKDYGYGELVDSMTGGLGFFHDFDVKKMNEIRYEDVVEETNKLFSNTQKEVNIVTNINGDNVQKLVLQYLSSSDIISRTGSNSKGEYGTREDSESDGIDDVDGDKKTESGTTPANYYRKNMVTLFEDVTDKAIVLVGGHAPNSSGFLSNGKHMSTLLEETFKASAENPEEIENVCALRRELWMHPAFPKAAGDLFMQLRTIKNLTYETTINVVTNDINHSYFVISSFCNNKNYPVLMAEILKYLKSLSSMEDQLSGSNLERCKQVIKNRIKSTGPTYYFKNITGIQLAEATTKNLLSLVEYEAVLDMITPEDFSLLMGSQVYGIDEPNLYTRALYSNTT